MSKKYLFKRIINTCFSVISSFVILTSSFVSYAGNDKEYIDNKVEHSDESFEDFTYYDCSIEEFEAIGANLDELLSKKDKGKEVIDTIKEMEKYYNLLDCNLTISNIYTNLDSTNEEYTDLYFSYYETAVDMHDELLQYYHKLALSDYSDEFKAYVDDEDDWQYILDYEPMTARQKMLLKKESDLSKKYDDLYDAEYTTIVDGKTYDMESLEEAYDAGKIDMNQFFQGIADITEDRNKVLGELFLDLVKIRTDIAKSYGFDNYVEYAYENEYGRDYSPEDLDEYREDIKENFAPLLEELQDYIGDSYSDLWDEIDETSISQKECYRLFSSKFDEVSSDLEEPFKYMKSHNLCNMDKTEVKAPTSYTTLITGNYNAPYISIDAEGTYVDLNTLIHEFGHYQAFYYASEEDYLYDSGNLDIDEIHSQGLEIIYSKFADEFYGDLADGMIAYNNLNYVYATVEGAKEDAFQIAIYENPENLTIDKLNNLYYKMSEEYGDAGLFYNSYYLGMYGMLKENQIYEWVEIPHTFQSPLYYISYSVSMSAVEEIRNLLNKDFDKGVKAYYDIVNYGVSGKYSEALEQAGLNNPITNPRFELYANNIRKECGLEYDEEIDAKYNDAEEFQDDELRNSDQDEDDVSEADKPNVTDEATSENNFDMQGALYVVLGALLVVLAIIVSIIVIIVSADKKARDN